MELASETRLSILMRLRDNPSKLSTLARFHDTTVQDIFRNLNRLVKEGLVRKGTDGLFFLTEYGGMVLNQMPYFGFLKRHKKFFEEHSLKKSNIPSKFLNWRARKMRGSGKRYSCFSEIKKTRIICK